MRETHTKIMIVSAEPDGAALGRNTIKDYNFMLDDKRQSLSEKP